MSVLAKELKLMNYGIQKKQGLGMSILFFCLGIVFELFPSMNMGCLGGYYILMIAMFPVQLIQLMGVSSLYCSSPLKYKIEKIGITLLSMVGSIFAVAFYIGLVFIRIYAVQGGGDAELEIQKAATSLIIIGVAGGLLELYNVIAYKYFGISLVVMLVVLMPTVLMATMYEKRNFYINIQFGLAAVFAFAMIVVFAGIAIGIAHLLRKKPLDPFTYKRAMNMAAK